MKTLQARLKEARLRRFATATEAATALGWNPSTYRSNENGHRPLSREKAIQYARGFRVNLEWLLTGKGPMEPGPGNHANLVPVFELEPGRTLMNRRDFKAYLASLKPRGYAGVPEGEYSSDQFCDLMRDDALNGAPTHIFRGDTLHMSDEVTPQPGDVVAVSVGPQILFRIYVPASRDANGQIDRIRLGVTNHTYDEPGLTVPVEQVHAVVVGHYHPRKV